MTTGTLFPIINIDCWLRGNTSGQAAEDQCDRDSLARVLTAALQYHGLVYVKSSLLSKKLIDRLRALMTAFFHLPKQVKEFHKYKPKDNRGYHTQIGNPQGVKLGEQPDEIQVFSIGKDITSPYELREEFYKTADIPESKWSNQLNHWPCVSDGVCENFNAKEFKEICLEVFEGSSKVIEGLLTALASGLELPLNFFSKYHSMHDFIQNFKLYSVLPNLEKSVCRVEDHTDFGSLTLVAQDSVGGLQVWVEDKGWCDVPPVDDCVVVHVGDQLERWTNGKCVSTRHRVISTKASNSQERCAVILFASPNWETNLKSPQKFGPPKFQEILVGDHVNTRLAELSLNFPDLKKSQ